MPPHAVKLPVSHTLPAVPWPSRRKLLLHVSSDGVSGCESVVGPASTAGVANQDTRELGVRVFNVYVQ